MDCEACNYYRSKLADNPCPVMGHEWEVVETDEGIPVEVICTTCGKRYPVGRRGVAVSDTDLLP